MRVGVRSMCALDAFRLQSQAEGITTGTLRQDFSNGDVRTRSMRERRNNQGTDRKTAPARSLQADFVMERFGSLRDCDRAFDIEYWQRQGDAAIFRAAWELVE